MEGWSVLDSIYFCVTTVATVGYGDVVPSRDASKLFTAAQRAFSSASGTEKPIKT